MAANYYSYAFDIDSRLVNIEETVKGEDYFCPVCGGAVIPKRGNKNRWHFCHKVDMAGCGYESYLHKLAKLRITECFNSSPHFYIAYYRQEICNVKECPVMHPEICRWKKMTDKFDLKKYFDECRQEVDIDGFRADLLLFPLNKKPEDSVLIEICVTHKSSEKKLSSKYRVIEINVGSEEDIDRIVNDCSLIETDEATKKGRNNIRFYGFRQGEHAEPPLEWQMPKYRFWIDEKWGNFHFDRFEEYDGTRKCLTPNDPVVANSVFIIESSRPVDWDFAFEELVKHKPHIRFCTICHYYRYNDRYEKNICILYKSKGTEIFPKLSCAISCEHYKLRGNSNVFRRVDFPCRIRVDGQPV